MQGQEFNHVKPGEMFDVMTTLSLHLDHHGYVAELSAELLHQPILGSEVW